MFVAYAPDTVTPLRSIASVAWADEPNGAELEILARRLAELEVRIGQAERATKIDPVLGEAELAKLLVRAQLRLSDGDYERAAFGFLFLAESHANSQAGAQAVHWLGRALMPLGMDRWAFECFRANLADTRADARRLHQQSIAGMLRLSAPAQPKGFARRPGLSATPEIRSRLRALGLPTLTGAPQSVLTVAERDEALLAAMAVPPAERRLALRYELSRLLFLGGRAAEARAELDAGLPLDAPLPERGRTLETAVKAAYLAGTIALSDGDEEAALSRFRAVQRVRAKDPALKAIVDLAWMAEARLHHDAGRLTDATSAYRFVSRDSLYFAEALYETVWTLLGADAHDRALQALDLLIGYDPESPLRSELLQLRGKILIAKRDFPSAESEFVELRKKFEAQRRQLAFALEARNDAVAYFRAVAAQDPAGFSLDEVIPTVALALARELPRLRQTEQEVRELGALAVELDELDALVDRMDKAIHARERARLFSDLSPQATAMEGALADVLDTEERLWSRIRVRSGANRFLDAEAERKRLKDGIDAPVVGRTREQVQQAIEAASEELHRQSLQIAALQSQLVAAERYYEATRGDQKIDAKGFLDGAAQVRDEIAVLQRENDALRRRVATEEIALRFEDPWALSRRVAQSAYETRLSDLYATGSSGDAAEARLFAQARQLFARAERARTAIDDAATRRLTRAALILEEERANLVGYRAELAGQLVEGQTLAGEVVAAGYRDVVFELDNQVTRAEVGLLDVAWAVQQAESEEINRLEIERARHLRDLEHSVDSVFDATKGRKP